MTAAISASAPDNGALGPYSPGDRIKFPETGNRWWTVRVADNRWAIATSHRPGHGADNLRYTIIDQHHYHRGPCDLIGNGYGDGTYSIFELVQMLMSLQAGVLGISHRNRVELRVTGFSRAEQRLPESFLVMGNGYALRTHNQEACSGEDRPCTVHRPSDHHMRSWVMNWRADRGLLERICPDHSTGHPDPDDLDYHRRSGREGMDVHGCCGCCVDPNRLALKITMPVIETPLLPSGGPIIMGAFEHPVTIEEPEADPPAAPRMDLAEFQHLGFLHEVNRLVLHPAGLAMSLETHTDGTVTFAGIIDRRDDPEGIVFDTVDEDLMTSVAMAHHRHAPYRETLLGKDDAVQYGGRYGDAVIQRESLTDTQRAKPEPTWSAIT